MHGKKYAAAEEGQEGLFLGGDTEQIVLCTYISIGTHHIKSGVEFSTYDIMVSA